MSTAAPRSGAFVRFWTAQTASQLGQRFGLVAMPVVAIEVLDAGPAEVGYLTASLTVCYLLVGLPAGAWVDRWSKRRTMIRSAWVRAVVLSTVPALWLADALSLTWMYVVGLVVGVASVFFDVAYQSLVPFLVEDDEIEGANARLEGSAQVAASAGPALAGGLVKVVSAPLLLAVDAAAYLVCALLLGTVRDKERRVAPEAPTSIAQDVREGVGFVLSQPVLRRLVLTTGVSNFFATIIMTLLPLLILRELDLDPAAMGIVLGIGTVGGIAGAAALPRVRRRLRAGTTMGAGLCLAAASTALFPLASSVPGGAAAAIGVLALAQVGMTFGAVQFNITQVSTRQRVCPPRLLGRMTSSIRFVVWGCMPAAAVTAGWLASGIGVVPAMWVGVVGTCVTVVPILGIDRIIEASTPAAAEAGSRAHA